MRIAGTQGIRSASKKKSAKSTSGKQSFQVTDSSVAGVSSAAPTSGTAAIGSIDSIIALQGVADPTEGRRKAVKRANSMLDTLDEIKLDLLSGSVPRGRLEQLLKLVDTQRENIENPQLSALLDDIELRARVELAKFGRVVR